MSTTNNEFHKITLDLTEAAKMLHLSTSSLREKAKNGEIPAAKLGKKWVFLVEDLVVCIRSKYHKNVEMLVSDIISENKTCHYTNEKTLGGSVSQRQMDKEYAVQLGLETKSKRKSITTT